MKAKLETEQALEEKALPLDVAIECLTLREGRQSIDVVRDGVEAELHKVCMFNVGTIFVMIFYSRNFKSAAVSTKVKVNTLV